MRCASLILAIGIAETFLGTTGCSRLVAETRVQTIAITTHPSGAWVQESDNQGQRNLGRAPVTVQKEYQVTVRRFHHWHWIWPVLLTGCAIGGMATGAADGDGAGLVAAAGLGCGVPALATLIANIVGEARSGRVIPGAPPQPVHFTAYLDNHSPQTQTVLVPGELSSLRLDLPRASAFRPVRQARPPRPQVVQPAQLSRLPPTPQPAVTPLRQGPIVAVFDVEDAAGRFDDKTLGQLTDYLAAKLTEETRFRVVPRNQLRARLVDEKREGYKKCYDESCQIDLGRAVAAQKSLATKLLQVGRTCAISTTLYDLKSETTEAAASIRTDCSENGLMGGMDSIVRQLARRAAQ
jgi:hypothetical protein